MSRGCQWISGDPRHAKTPGADDMKCGKPVAVIGASFCRSHLKRCYVDRRSLGRVVAAIEKKVAWMGSARAAKP